MSGSSRASHAAARVLLTLLVALPLATSACGTSSGDGAPSAPAASADDAPAGDGEGGISRDEAEASGTLTGPYDAVLVPVSRSARTFDFELSNVGTSADSYAIAVEGPGEVDVASVRLASGSTSALRIVVDADAEPSSVSIVVRSSGRDAEVVRVPADWKG